MDSFINCQFHVALFAPNCPNKISFAVFSPLGGHVPSHCHPVHLPAPSTGGTVSDGMSLSLSGGRLPWSNSWWTVCSGEAWARLQKQFPHPDRAGHVLLGLGSHSSLPVEDRTSPVLFPSQELRSPSVTAKTHPEKPKSPGMSDLPTACHTHTYSNPGR